MIEFEQVEGIQSGTSLKGHIKASYAELVECFGEPIYQGDRDGHHDKVWNEWVLEFKVPEEDEDDFDYVVATIYDWKERGPFESREAVAYDWHIGGKDYRATDCVEQVLENYRMNLVDQQAEGILA